LAGAGVACGAGEVPMTERARDAAAAACARVVMDDDGCMVKMMLNDTRWRASTVVVV
jgi:hypothetical protein